MSSHTAIPGTKSSGDAWTAANVNDLPGGWIGYVQITSDQGSITSEADISGLSQAVTVNTSRRIKLTAYCAALSSSVAGDVINMYIKESTTKLTAAKVNDATADGETAMAQVILTPGSGSHTYKVSVERSTGSGNITFQAGALYPGYLLIEDIGPA